MATLPSFSSPLKSAFAAPALKAAPASAVVYDSRTRGPSYVVGLGAAAAGPPFSTHIVPTYGPQSTPFYGAGYAAAAYPHQYYGLY